MPKQNIIPEKNNSHLSNIKTHVTKGESFLKKSQFDEAALHFEKALYLCESHECAEKYKDIAFRYAIVLINQGRYNRALDFLNVALTIKNINKNDNKYLSIITNIGNANFFLGNFNVAYEYYDKVIHQKEFITEQLYSNTLANAASTLRRLGKNKKALQFYKKVLAHEEKRGDLKSKAMTLNSIGATYLRENKLKNAIPYFEKAIDIQVNIKDEYSLLKTMNNLGNTYIQSGDYTQGKSFIDQSLHLSKKLKIRESIKRSYGYLADMYKRKEDFKQSVHYQEKYIELSEDLLNKHILDKAENHQREIEKLNVNLETERRERTISELNRKIELKNTELANKAMLMAERQEALLEIFEEIDYIRQAHGGMMSPEFRKLYQDLQEQLSSETQWEEFEKWFSEVQSTFFSRLREMGPKLTTNEIKIAAFIKLHMSTKEIATLMRLSPKTIENNRWSIRKKIGLKKGDNLILFLENL